MELLALGPLELWQDGRQHDLGSVKERCVLAVLVHARGGTVTAETLMDRVWDGEPPRTALDTLHSYLSRLRGHLKRAVGSQILVERPSPRAYRLRMDPEDLDLLRLARLREDAARALDEGRADLAIGLLHTAEALWRGDPLAEFTGSWTASLRDRLVEDHRRVREERIRLELEAGRHADVLGELRELVARNPLAQTALASLMLALYRCGRHDEALAVYRTARRRLQESQGIEPGTELRALHHRILGQDPGLLLPPVATRTPAPREPARAAPDTLPRDIGEFTGRTAELRILLTPPRKDALPVTVVHGMPGVGKTALVVHAAHQLREAYPDGAFHLDLRGYSGQPPSTTPEALGALLHTAGIPDPLPGTADERAARWREWTARRRVLVVLDNARDATQVGPLLPGSATCRVLVTSRHRIADLGGAVPLHLDVLSATEATTLFQRVLGPGRPADADGALARIVDACGRHPLALHLLAGHLRHRTAWALDDLADHLARLRRTPHSFDPALTVSFQLSYNELDLGQRELLRTIALHPGPDITTDAAAALARRAPGISSDEHVRHVRRSLEELLDRNLLEESARDRYRLHDLTRAFSLLAGHREDTPESSRAALDRLLDHYLTAAHRADRSLHPHRHPLPLPPRRTCPHAPHFAGPDEAAPWLSLERANLLALARTAAASCTVPASAHEQALLLPHALGPSLKLWGLRETAVELYDAAADALRGRADDPALLAHTLVELADVWAQKDHHRALRLAEESLSLFTGLGDTHGRADALLQSGRAHLAAGRADTALTDLDEALALYRAIDDRAGQAACRNVQGLAHHYAGRHAPALHAVTDVLSLYDELGDGHGSMRAWNNLGELSFLQGRFDEARHHYERALCLARLHGGRQDLSILDTNLGAVHQATGRPETALDYFRRALACHQDSGDTLGEVNVLISMGTAYAATGRRGEALLHLTRAEQAARSIGNSYERQRALLAMADVQLTAGRRQPAQRLYATALAVAQEVGLSPTQALDGLARAERARDHGVTGS
ncbi:BTAD domain-containing putative transcriptional regulator [Streptomyces sp. NPDC050085]|uniref:AfsR/SARP family transcriptional regulator n=1 Tax=Streptomyces sp. NPDC050085 TaxID=3365600 RepID=UPI0037897A0D